MNPKTRKCKCGCGESFIPTNSMQPTTNDFECKVRYAEKVAERSRAKREQEERASFRKRKEAAKQSKTLKAEAQAAFNAFIRYRDRHETCIDCGKPFEPDRPGGSVDAGHFLGVGIAPNLRFIEDNCNAQRKNCNRPGGTTREKYRAGLVARIGEERVSALEAMQAGEARYRADDYRQIRDTYRAKLRALKREADKEPNNVDAE